MAKLNPIEQSKFIEKEYREFLKDTFYFEDNDYEKQFLEELDNESLYKGPYLNLNLPFKSLYSIDQLIEKGEMSPLFKKLSNINFDLKLYTHQYKSLTKIKEGRNVVITTGTGSGKTESFLYPILNSILTDIENGNNGAGIRAIFLYPMNALVNDQIDRVRKILRNYPEIKYGFYTGDTPNDYEHNKGYKAKIENLNGCEIPPNEMLFREDMRKEPPHLMFTNYSMLEYMLIRPNDKSMFKPEYLDKWKFVVLDEAHTYNGALGIELSYLLRRLTGLIPKKPQFILTSATLGEKNKDEDKIIKFANSLTSSEYTNEDIIFSDRIFLDRKNIEYTINPKEYIDIEKSIDDLDKLNQISKKYLNKEYSDIKLLLYELLIRDENVYNLYDLLVNGSITFHDTLSNLNPYGFTEESLVSLIAIINKARKEGKMIYDIKYHTFIKTISGAYVTLKPEKFLKLIPYKQFNELKMFELGNCRYCNTPYVIGRIHDDYLYQNTDIDIYENYDDDVEFVNLDYFLISEHTQVDDKIEEKCDKYTVCSKCGHIYKSDNKNAEKCSCGESYEVKLLRVNSYSEKKNNITTCPVCSHNSSTGVVHGLNLGKDMATAILSQILYKAIDPNDEEVKENNFELSFDDYEIPEKNTTNDYCKQFIAFSESRQQASYFASFFDYNHLRFLRKRLIWEIIKDNNFNELTFEQLVTKLELYINSHKVFDSKYSNNKQAWITALYELLKVDGDYSAENLGLFYFKLNIDDILNRFQPGAIEKVFGKYNINRDDLKNILNVIFSNFRSYGAIDYTEANLNGIERKDEFEYKSYQNAFKLQLQLSLSSNNIFSFLPISESGINNQTKYIMRILNCSKNEAIEILKLLFNTIGVKGGLFRSNNNIDKDAYIIPAHKYVLCNYKNSKYYKCDKCGFVTPFNVHNKCYKAKCDGTLKECNPDEVFKNNYYRKQYMNKKIEKVVVKEHTAQLSSTEAKEYQKEFKNKLINILSCSTTFEMGVDIGGLETVFLRNVPPTPANYVQRAGRAGRSDDSSAFVLTFCGSSSHDYTYFDKPEKMISGKITPPDFDLKNEKIIVRHLLATSLGYFFRLYPIYFANIRALVIDDGINKFKEYLDSKPKDLNEYINNKILIPSLYEFKDFKWYEYMMKESNYLDNFASSIKTTLEDLDKAYKDSKEKDKMALANSIQKEINTILETEVLEYLSTYNVIPKYGFPVDVVSLEIWENGKRNKKYDLQRDLSVAISEYAPESEIIVDKQKYTSRYINLPKSEDSSFIKYYYYKCSKCGRENVNILPENLNICSYCNEPNSDSVTDFFIEPRYGFKTGENISSGKVKPKKTYTGKTIYLGKGKFDKEMYIAHEYLKISTTEDDELLVMNATNFFMCNECGYTKIEKSKPIILNLIEEHQSYRGYKCNNTSLHGLRLGHKFKTDVATIRLKDVIDRTHALSFLYALLEGISEEFTIDRRDLDGLIVSNEYNSYDILVFDNVPGGAGHVKRIMNANEFINTLKKSLEKVNQDCCDESTSCYNCLRNYNNQAYHKELSRKAAREVIENILKRI